MKTTKLSITNKNGLKLAACLDSPEADSPKYYAVFAHCFTCSKDLKSIGSIDEALIKYGIAVLRFDMTGIGESEGNFPDTNFTTQIEDFLSAADFLKTNYKAPQLLIGHSIGGCVAIESALKLPSVKAVATIGTPSEPSHLSIKLRKTKARTLKDGIGETVIGGVKFQFKPQFWQDIESYTLKNDLPELNRPLLILHSPVDTYTPFENASELFKIAKEPKKFISLDDIDHLMLKKSDAFHVGDLIGTWFLSLGV
jgi:alpha-beta hydrolase superfamily lysophospholipase